MVMVRYKAADITARSYPATIVHLNGNGYFNVVFHDNGQTVKNINPDRCTPHSGASAAGARFKEARAAEDQATLEEVPRPRTERENREGA